MLVRLDFPQFTQTILSYCWASCTTINKTASYLIQLCMLNLLKAMKGKRIKLTVKTFTLEGVSMYGTWRFS